MTSQYQTVTLVLDDGRRWTFTGPAMFSEGDPVRVVEIVVTTAQPLPEGYVWRLIRDPEVRYATGPERHGEADR